MNESIVLGGGCFWCLEAAFQLINGVTSVISGYAGGDDPKPTYESVCEGNTGHAEVVRVTFNPALVTLSDILSVFWTIHDPTTLNRQGADIGSQYRSIILYEHASQTDGIAASIEEVSTLWSQPITTEVSALSVFYPAEAYHQNFFVNHPEQGYCQAVINPKLTKLRHKLDSLLKET